MIHCQHHCTAEDITDDRPPTQQQSHKVFQSRERRQPRRRGRASVLVPENQALEEEMGVSASCFVDAVGGC